jgi:hypothetical protein
MRYRLSQAWSLFDGTWIVPTGTVIDSASDDQWSVRAKGLTPPLNAVPMDAEAYEAQVREFPEHRHLLSGGWEEK